jgi:hypothetical protein
LILAYEGAQESSNGNLKLHITKLDQKLAANAPVEKASVEKEIDDKMSSSSSESDDEKTDDFVVVQPKKEKKWKHKDGQNKYHKKQRKMKKIIKHMIKHQTKELMQSISNQNFESDANASAQPVFG